MVRIRIGVAGRPWIKMSAGSREIGLALADRMQVHSVASRREAGRGDPNLHDAARALTGLGEFGRAGDAFARDHRLRGDGAGRRRLCWILGDDDNAAQRKRCDHRANQVRFHSTLHSKL
jgi:hypothetical protein